MIWGCISKRGKAELMFVDGRMDTAAYIKIMQDHLVPFMGRPTLKFRTTNKIILPAIELDLFKIPIFREKLFILNNSG